MYLDSARKQWLDWQPLQGSLDQAAQASENKKSELGNGR